MKTKTPSTINKTTIAISPDGSITISKTTEKITEQVLVKAEASETEETITEQLLSKAE